MTLDALISMLVTIMLIQMMVTIGLGVTVGQVAEVARDWKLLFRAALANYILVPMAAVGLLLLVGPHPMVAVGFLIAIVCPGAPYGPPLTALAKGNVPASVGLMVVLAASSAVIAPILLMGLLPFLSADQSLKIDVAKIITTLLVTQLLPLLAGLYVRHRYPFAANAIKRPSAIVSMILNASVFALIVFVQFETLTEIRLIGFAGMLALLMTALVAGWALGGPGGAQRKAMALTTAARNVGVSLVIVTASFPGSPAVTATLAYAVFQTIVLTLLSLGWGRVAPVPAELAR